MALMMDNKPTEYKGEALVWEKLSSLLPNDVVVYNHREVVDDREFDFALLIKNVGIMVIEVKGWQSQYIFDVKGPDEIVIQGESQIYGSPEKQARGYRFDWLNFLNDQFAISPVVLSMVCYPFISEKEYKDVRLDIVSSRDFTIFSDDLNSATKLGQKISNAFVKKKPLNSTPFDEKAMAIVRQHFEPSYKAKDDQIVEVSDAYSLLKVFNKELTEKDSDELIEMYFAGTKIVVFVKSDYPLSCISAHVSASPNHQTLRNMPLESRFAVAAFGLLGYECNMCDMNKEELNAVKCQIELYKKLRNVFFTGTFYRTESFEEENAGNASVLNNGKGNMAEWTVVSTDKKKAVGLIMQKHVIPNTQYACYRAKGLDEAKKYHFYNRKLQYDIKEFGELVNMVSPIHIKQGSMLQDILSKLKKMDGETEDYIAYGDTLMYSGVKLKQAFSATGYNENVRFFQDFAARLYFMEEVEDDKQ